MGTSLILLHSLCEQEGGKGLGQQILGTELGWDSTLGILEERSGAEVLARFWPPDGSADTYPSSFQTY